MDDLFFQLFSTGIPYVMWMGAVLLGLVLTIGFCIWGGVNRRKWMVGSWAGIYIFLILYTTVLRREPTEGSLNLIPLWSIGAIRDGYIETLYEKLYNILLYMPLGLIAGFYPLPRKRGYLKLLLFGLGTSIAIELLQLLTQTGMCETDDVLCNTLGFALASGVGALMGKIYTGGSDPYV